MTTISAVFDNDQDVENVIRELHEKGFADNEIGVMMTDKRKEQLVKNTGATRVPEGVATGAALGGVLGAIIAGLAAIGSITIPGVGVLASGPIVAALAGGGAGAAVGGLTGALVGWGIPEHEAKLYEHHIKQGKVLISVNTDDARTNTVRSIFNNYHAHDIAA